MILITGGAYQGKEAFAQNLKEQNMPDENDSSENAHADKKMMDAGTYMIADENAAVETLYTSDIWNHYHLWVARILKENLDPWRLTEQVLEKNADIIICSTELGCGIVPVDAFDRNWREVTGRLCCMLAKNAETVYRVNCGIGVRIK